MNGNPKVASARPLPNIRLRGCSALIADLKLRRRRARLERLEVIERLASEARHARRSGEYIPNLGRERPLL